MRAWLACRLTRTITLALTQSEPPFLVAQIAVLAFFVILGAIAVRRFRPAMMVRT